MAEWSNAAVLKTVIPCEGNREFESLSLLHPTPRLRMETLSLTPLKSYPSLKYLYISCVRIKKAQLRINLNQAIIYFKARSKNYLVSLDGAGAATATFSSIGPSFPWQSSCIYFSAISKSSISTFLRLF